jgi:hypothetical protein
MRDSETLTYKLVQLPMPVIRNIGSLVGLQKAPLGQLVMIISDVGTSVQSDNSVLGCVRMR